jgi:hypothetical protein
MQEKISRWAGLSCLEPWKRLSRVSHESQEAYEKEFVRLNPAEWILLGVDVLSRWRRFDPNETERCSRGWCTVTHLSLSLSRSLTYTHYTLAGQTDFLLLTVHTRSSAVISRSRLLPFLRLKHFALAFSRTSAIGLDFVRLILIFIIQSLQCMRFESAHKSAIEGRAHSRTHTWFMDRDRKENLFHASRSVFGSRATQSVLGACAVE